MSSLQGNAWQSLISSDEWGRAGRVFALTSLERLRVVLRTIHHKALIIALVAGMGWIITQGCEAQTGHDHKTVGPKNQEIGNTIELEIGKYSQGEAKSAGEALAALVGREPDNIVALETLGLMRADQGQFIEALPYLEHAYAVSPTSLAVSTNLGSVYLKLQRFNDAERIFRIANRLAPKSGKLEARYGEALMGMGRYSAASDAFGAAVKLSPDDGDYRYNWVLALYSAKQFSSARHALEGLAGKDDSATAQALWADIEERQGHISEAILHYHAAAILNPSVENIYALGLELVRHEKFTAAKKIYDYGRSLYPSEKEMEVGWALAEYGNNDFGSAATDFARLLELDPQNEMFESMLERSCKLLMGQSFPSCDGLVSLAAKHAEREPLVISAVSYLLHYPGDPAVDLDTANQILQLANRSGVRSAEFHYLMGVFDQEKRLWGRSIAPLEEAIKLNPHLAEAHYRLSQAYFRLGRREDGSHEIAALQNERQPDSGKDEGIGTDLLASPGPGTVKKTINAALGGHH